MVIIGSLDWKVVSEIGTFIVAIWGAALATYVWYEQRRLRFPRIRVKFSHGMVTGHSGQLGEPMVFLKAVNEGERPVLLKVPVIRLPDGKSLVWKDILRQMTFPHELRPGRSCQAWIDRKALFSRLREEGFRGRIAIRAEYHDETDRVYKSKPWKADLQWADEPEAESESTDDAE